MTPPDEQVELPSTEGSGTSSSRQRVATCAASPWDWLSTTGKDDVEEASLCGILETDGEVDVASEGVAMPILY